MIQPYRYGDLVQVNGGREYRGKAVVLNYEADQYTHGVEFSYTVLRCSDGQEQAWFDHKQLRLIKEGDEAALETAKNKRLKWIGSAIREGI